MCKGCTGNHGVFGSQIVCPAIPYGEGGQSAGAAWAHNSITTVQKWSHVSMLLLDKELCQLLLEADSARFICQLLMSMCRLAIQVAGGQCTVADSVSVSL